MEGIYKVNIVPNDLSTEETVYQIADSLDNLNEIVDDVFNKLLSRIQSNIDRSEKLMRRIEVSKEKVDQLSKIKKAIKVFSPAKYPSCIQHKYYQSVFGKDPYNYVPKPYYLSTTQQKPPNEDDLQEKLHFFHVKMGKLQTKPRFEKRTLRDVIQNISTVGELLIFNTDESPYFGPQSKTINYIEQNRANQSKAKGILDAAPSTITNREHVLKTDVDEYLYTPGMGHVPELEMPLDLPHLPGIAGDLQLTMANDKAIAPSVVTSPTDVEIITELPDINIEVQVLPDIPDIPDSMDVTPNVEVVPPPPPPPPPALPAQVEVLVDVKADVRAPTPASPPPGNAHSSLMAAIRLAGGAGKAGLKPAASSASTPTKMSKPNGGDLMADLHAKLSMRRRGISGAERGVSGDSMLHALARIIPDSGEQSTPQQSSGDEDWE